MPVDSVGPAGSWCSYLVWNKGSGWSKPHRINVDGSGISVDLNYNVRNRDYNNRVHLDSGEEFEELGEAFNGMLDEISSRVREAQMAAIDPTVARDLAVDALRTQAVFVQNVSHEFMVSTPVASRKGLHISLQIGDQLPPILGNEESVKQIWAALISNAIKFTPMNHRIEVRAQERDGDLVVEVQDEGCGIPKKDKDHIFDSFALISKDHLIGKPSGAGLGLTIAAKIIADHKGRIDVDSQIGVGSCFRITLPGALKPEPALPPLEIADRQ